MNPGSILFVLAMLVLTGAYVARPLSEQLAAGGLMRAHPQRSRLQARRERLLGAIQELDADHAMGKVLPEEYRQQRRQLLMLGAQVLRQLDELGELESQPDLEAELEARVGELRRELGSQEPEAGSGAQIADAAGQRAGTADRAERHSGSAAKYCPACGTAAVADDRFCSNCGTALPEQGD